MSMFEQLQESMNRRQAAISGKKDRLEKKRDTIALMQNPDTFRQKVRSSLTDAGIDIMAEKKEGEDESESDSDSDASSNGRDRVFSDESYKDPAATPAPAPAPAPTPAPKATAKQSAAKKVRLPDSPDRGSGGGGRQEDARRGSLWDSNNKDLQRMLSSKAKDKDNDGSEDSDWDE